MLFFLFWKCAVACRILVSQPGIESVPTPLQDLSFPTRDRIRPHPTLTSCSEVQSPNHWITREFPKDIFQIDFFSFLYTRNSITSTVIELWDISFHLFYFCTCFRTKKQRDKRKLKKEKERERARAALWPWLILAMKQALLSCGARRQVQKVKFKVTWGQRRHHNQATMPGSGKRKRNQRARQVSTKSQGWFIKQCKRVVLVVRLRWFFSPPHFSRFSIRWYELFVFIYVQEENCNCLKSLNCEQQERK